MICKKEGEKYIIRNAQSVYWNGNRYTARCIWQMLFNIYREKDCPINNLDNLLCDLGEIEQYVKTRTNFYWSAYYSNTYISSNKDDIDSLNNWYVEVTLTDSEIVAEIKDSFDE